MISSRQSRRLFAARPRWQTLVLATAMTLPMFAGSGAAFAQFSPYVITIEPETPRAQQAVYATVAMPGCRVPKDVRFVDGVIEIGVASTWCGVPPPGLYPRSVSLGKLPQGTYRVRVASAPDGPARPEYTFTVEPPVEGEWQDEHEPLLDYSGWWTTEDPTLGEGWLVEHKVPDRLMFSWVTYDDEGNPTWLVMQSTERDHRALIGPVYRSERQDGTIVRTIIGEGRFEGFAPDEARFTLTPSEGGGDPVVTELRRLPF
jgi:hypothetical protein